nr:glycoside hydrolase family 5 protein [Dysgonomonas macrotermitis]
MESDSKVLASKIIAGWNLGNSLEAISKDRNENSEIAWRNPQTTKAMIDSVAIAGFNAIRIPICWYPHFTDDNNIKIDEKWINRVKEVVGYCLDNDLYVIINTHHEHWLENHPFFKDSTEVYRKEALLWKEIATIFKDYDERLLFAGTNEVHIKDDWGAPGDENVVVQNGFNRVFIDAVRSTGGKNTYRNLIIQTYGANSEYGPGHLEIPHDPTPNRLMVEVHYYDPYGYCGTDDIKFWGKPYEKYGIDSIGQEDFVENRFLSIKKLFVDKGHPVILGEWGAPRHSVNKGEDEEIMNKSRAYYYEKIVSIAKKNGMVPFVWDNGYSSSGPDQFGLFDRKDGMKNIDKSTIDAIMKGAQTNYPF